jgi:hypothetical protein
MMIRLIFIPNIKYVLLTLYQFYAFLQLLYQYVFDEVDRFFNYFNHNLFQIFLVVYYPNQRHIDFLVNQMLNF